jgi:c(7)-type cytochrome triheme protein
MSSVNSRSLGYLMFACGAAVFAMLVLASLAKAQSDPNRFNRLMKPSAERNLPPATDGIHDPESEGSYMLQAPLESFIDLPKSKSGNYVHWNEAIDQGLIAPRNSIGVESLPPIVLDLNIIREVKGSMPDVVYPHKQHTQWLDCANCHPAIFIPQKGANQISMASILLGEKCGVCHGKVAFPVSECRRCHSRPKQQVANQ